MKLIGLSINVSKIDKEKLIKGKQGSYLNVTLAVNDEPDQYGNNVSCWQGQSKEEREAKKERNFLGNGKVIWEGDSKPQATTKPKQDDGDDGSLPF